MNKVFDLGVIVGRFQCLHVGHVELIRTGLLLCNRLVVLVGSAQEMRTERNPFSFVERKYFIQKSVSGSQKVDILPLVDQGLGNNSQWGDYVMNFLHEAGYNPNLIISGRESRRESWFKNSKGIFELIVPKLNEVSGTMVRDLIKKDRAEEWKRCVPDLLWEDYNTIRSIVVESSDNINTQSI